MKFSEKLKQLREIKGMSQARLAKAAGISTSVVCNYENEKRKRISHVIILSLADALGVSWQQLVAGTELQSSAAQGISGHESLKGFGGQASFNGAPISAADAEAASKQMRMQPIINSIERMSDEQAQCAQHVLNDIEELNPSGVQLFLDVSHALAANPALKK